MESRDDGKSASPLREGVDPPLRVQGEPSDISDPIFICGCHRSGTSVLRMLMDTHPRISSGPEDISVYRFASMDTDSWRGILSEYGLSEEEWLDMVRGMIVRLHTTYAKSQNKTRWAAKCPENALILDYIDKLFPTAQVLNIVRHPRDVIASNQKKYGRRRDAMYGARWVDHVRAAEKMGARLGDSRFKTIRYEDLVTDTESVMKDVFAWLGESWSPDVLRFGERTHKFPPRLKDNTETQFEMHTRSIGRGGVADAAMSLAYIRIKANSLATKYGYSVFG
jgi:hypothetical protein